MRGEHRHRRGTGSRPRGSSPHARGAQGRERTAASSSGIIPACAGSTSKVSVNAVLRGDHPRMRGEHVRAHAWQDYIAGSSPHARGAHLISLLWVVKPGIIPACAGSTRALPPARIIFRDHPRMRGEHFASQKNRPSGAGSSPHARGAPRVGIPSQ